MNIHVQPLGQPTPGSAKPGNLYADLQSRSLWLGVNLDVDSSGSVLISDMMQLMEDIATAEANANAYTDAQILTRAPLVHTHPTSDIIDFTSAVQGIVTAMPGLSFNTGTVLMFSGDPTDIGIDEWVGWALCNGLNGTPNLTDRFVMGYSGLPGHGMGQVNAPTTAATSTHNGHTHVGGNTTLTLAQIPSHQHGPGTYKGITTGSVSANAAHSHFITCTTNSTPGGTYRPLLQPAGDAVNVYTDAEPGHQHGITALDITVNSGLSTAAGSGQAHSHTIALDGAHSHTLATAQLREAIPFYALAFIIKL